MTTITDTSILNWLPFDDNGEELWKFAQGNIENQTLNGTDLNNSTSSLTMMVASKHGANNSMFTSPAHLGLATGLLLSLIINSRIWTTKANREVFGHKLLFGNRKPYQWILHLTPSSSFTFASSKTFILPYLYFLPIIAVLFLLPILSAFTVLLLPFVIYRLIVYTYLQCLSKSPLKKNLFSGADAVWTFNESYESFSVINALIILEGQPDIAKLRDILRVRLGSFPKLKMRHGFTLGYATWYEDPDLDLGNLVQWIPGMWGKSDGKKAEGNLKAKSGQEGRYNSKIDSPSHTTWDRNNLSKIVEKLCNVPLPEGHSVSWEARVGKAMPWSEGSGNDVHDSRSSEINLCLNEESVRPTVFPILFRIHHSVGDGASLLQLLMSTLIDDGSDLPIPISGIGNEKSDLSSVTRPLTFASPRDHSIEHKVIPRENNNDAPSSDVQDMNDRKHAANLLSKNKCGKSYDIGNEESKGKESSFLYGRRLSGKKTILWDSTSVTVEEIKKIRSATGVKFTEILLSAISAALSTYWETREKDQLHDVNDVHKKHHRKIGKKSSDGHRILMRSTRECESEDDWDRLEDVEEESEGDGHHQKDCTKEKECVTKIEKPPTSVKLVLPAILGSLFQKQKDLALKSGKDLENLFSVAVMTLPVGKSGGCPLQRLSKVSESSGYMMPLRKDSIVTCENKMKNFMSSNDEASNQSTSHIGVTDALLRDTDDHNDSQDQTYKMPLPNYIRENPSQSSSATKLKPEPIKTDQPKVLTYYYTKQTVQQIQSYPQISPPLTKTAHVQYCKNSDSAEVVIQEKEPYHSPTTIFFTQNNKEKSADCKAKREYSPKMDSSVQTIEEIRTSRSEITSAIHEQQRVSGVPMEIRPINKDGLISTPAMQANGQNQSNQAKCPSSIQFPSSPTIQHLLTRWLALDVVATVLPSIFAAPMMSVAANGVAVVMSNLPGPPKRLESILGGHPLKDIVFWAPHRGCTGLGVTILSYDGRLHVGLMADKAVVPTQKGAQLLMNTILDELHSLEAAVSCSH